LWDGRLQVIDFIAIKEDAASTNFQRVTVRLKKDF
jgi:hypothetical protein